MQVSPINNNSVSTKGRFVKNITLDRMIERADVDTLKRFREVIARAKRVDDGNIFKVSSHIFTENNRVLGEQKFCHFYLLKGINGDEFNKSVIDKVSFKTSVNAKKDEILSKTTGIFKTFIKTLEDMYPQGNETDVKAFLIAEATDNMIEE